MSISLHLQKEIAVRNNGLCLIYTKRLLKYSLTYVYTSIHPPAQSFFSFVSQIDYFTSGFSNVESQKLNIY